MHQWTSNSRHRDRSRRNSAGPPTGNHGLPSWRRRANSDGGRLRDIYRRRRDSRKVFGRRRASWVVQSDGRADADDPVADMGLHNRRQRATKRPPTFTGINGESYPAIMVGATETAGIWTKAGVWTYNTAGLPPCGYTIQLSTGDRTIVNCVTNWEDNSWFRGFCLVAKK